MTENGGYTITRSAEVRPQDAETAPHGRLH